MTRAELDGLVAIGVITRREADFVWLHDVKGLSYRVIGLAHGVSGQNVHERVRRGHEKIRRAKAEAA